MIGKTLGIEDDELVVAGDNVVERGTVGIPPGIRNVGRSAEDSPRGKEAKGSGGRWGGASWGDCITRKSQERNGLLIASLAAGVQSSALRDRLRGRE